MDNKITFLGREPDGPDGLPVYRIKVEAEECPFCGSKSNHIQKRVRRSFLDVDENGELRVLDADCNRLMCTSCGKTFSPLGKGSGSHTTPEYIEWRLTSYFEGDATIKSLGGESTGRKESVRKALRDFKNNWDEKKRYVLPEEIGLTTLPLRSGILIALTDVIDMTVLDILGPEEAALLDLDKVKTVYLTDTRIPETVLEAVGDKAVLLPGSRVAGGLDAVMADAAADFRDREGLREVLEAGPKEQREYLVRNVVCTPYVLQARAVLRGEQPDDTSRLGQNVRGFYEGLDRTRGLKEADPDDQVIAEYGRRVRRYAEEARSLPEKFRSQSQAVSKLLYRGQVSPALVSETGEVFSNFGRRL